MDLLYMILGAPTYSAFTHSNISLTGLNAGSYKVWRTTATSSYVGVGQFEFYILIMMTFSVNIGLDTEAVKLSSTRLLGMISY